MPQAVVLSCIFFNISDGTTTGATASRRGVASGWSGSADLGLKMMGVQNHDGTG